MSRSVNWHYFLTSVDFASIPLADDLDHRMKRAWWNGQRKGREKTENILAGCIKLSYTTSMFYLCQQIKKKASGIIDVIYWQAQKHPWQAKELRTSNLGIKCCMYACVYIYICTVGSNRDTGKHVGQAEFVKLKLQLLPFPILSSQTTH